ncbi:MAG TPA: M28 family peptidase [Phycisphaerae bacterium]|nr:M28 family peptidase [Phycisphaerae bacterium]
MTSRQTCLRLGLAATLLCASTTAAGEIGHQIVDQIDLEHYRHYLDDLLYTHDGDNRGRFGPEHDLARDAIAATLESFGLQVELHAFEYAGSTYYNVVATQPGTVFPDAQYIVGGHFDSVNNPGADDNGSGVAAMLEVAYILSMYEPECTVKYIAFDLEEHGLVGSRAYATEHQSDDIRGVLVLDMIAHDAGAYKCRVYGDPASNPIKYLVADAIGEYAPELAYMIVGEYGDPADFSDHAPFEDVGFQGCLLIEDMHGTNPCYHRQCDSVDTPDYIHYAYGLEFARAAAGFLADQAAAQYPFDCNGNDVPDQDEIQQNPSLDCNGNGVLDACEHQGFEDCNANGIADACDISDGTSHDFNGNGIPDECDCLGDLDGDGVIDQADLGMLLTDWGCTSNCAADLDGDDDVDHSDLGILLSTWQMTCY